MKFPSILKGLMANSVVRETFSALLMKILAVAFGFLLNIVLARKMGAAGTGLYYISLSSVSIASVLSQFGLGQSVLKFMAVYSSQNDWSSVKGVLQKSWTLCFISSLLVSAGLYCSVPVIVSVLFHNEQLVYLIRIMVCSIPAGALFVLNGYSLQGLKKIVLSVFVNGVSMPLFTVIFMVIFVPKLGVNGGCISFVIASWATLLLSFVFLIKVAPDIKKVHGRFDTGMLLKSNLPLFWVSISQLVMVWSSSIILAIWASESAVGLFNIANKIALLVSFILSCVNTVIAPRYASLYSSGNIAELGRIAGMATLFMTCLSIPVFSSIVFFPEYILSFFGLQFIQGAPVLRILAVGQFLYVITGAVGYLLTMSGHERVMRNIMLFCSFLLVILNLLLVPRYGALGAAVATSVALVMQNIVISLMVWKIIGVSVLPHD